MKMVKTVLFAFAIALVAACAKEEPSKSQASSEGVMIQEIKVGVAENGGDMSAQPITQDQPIRVEVQSAKSGSAMSAMIEVKLIELKTGLVAATAKDQLMGGGSAAVLELKGTQDWPPGRYLIEVRVDGKLLASRDVDVFGATSGG